MGAVKGGVAGGVCLGFVLAPNPPLPNLLAVLSETVAVTASIGFSYGRSVQRHGLQGLRTQRVGVDLYP